MKVQIPSNVIPMFERVSGKPQDKQGGAGQNAYERQQKKEQEEPASEQDVLQAVETFGSDPMNHEHGITATSEGQGPGLRVILKDAGGGVLRNVSGDEFLRLREAVKEGRKSGRILDQKA